ncbi:hypothetical protein RRG08_014117 [Elysia crispata]|uniref:Uncharacterized protein n=1 Tax=Elysia crispata TaxID=231223 RepID=A0AAE0ZZ95_9GAST|nr:hypothetical protein RRG08_014117 [Elysia crispata]
MKVVKVSLAICLVATFVCGLTDGKQAELAKLQESLREAKLYYEGALAKVDTLSRDEIITCIHKAFDLNYQLVIDLSVYNGLGPKSPTYDDLVSGLNQLFDEGKKYFTENIKDLDDDALKQKFTNELNNMIQATDIMPVLMGVSG